MQYELKTQVIEPSRHTFTHIKKRLGDRPASRYEEASIAIQPKENFHFRPTWAPDKELYDPAYSEYKLADPDAFQDPRHYYYTPYVTNRSTLHEAFGKTLDYVESRELFAKTSPQWRDLMAQAMLPMRHYESGAQLVFSMATRFSYGSTVSQCMVFSAFDRIGLAQLISRVGIALGGGTADLLTEVKSTWTDAPHMQGLRRYVEEALVEEDWADSVVAYDLADLLIYGLMYRELDEAALMGGAGAYSLIVQHLTTWFADQRKMLDALYAAWLADEEHGERNREVFSAQVNARFGQAVEAVGAIADHMDTLVDGIQARAALDRVAEQTRTYYTDLGLDLEPAAAE